MNKIVTTYLNGAIDPQRKHKWIPSIEPCRRLIESANAHGCDVVIITDCITDKDGIDVELVQVSPSDTNPYHRRWGLYWNYVIAHRGDLAAVFFVDATDVEVLRNPFDVLRSDTLYVGDEDWYVDNKWLRRHHDITDTPSLYNDYGDSILLNAGVIGGNYYIIKDFLLKMHFWVGGSSSLTDMAIFNNVLYKDFSGNLVHGSPVTTKFKQFDYDNTECWFRHK